MNEKVKSPGRSPSSRLASPDPSCRMQTSPGLFKKSNSKIRDNWMREQFKKQQCGYYLTANTKNRFYKLCTRYGISPSDLAEYAIKTVLDVVENIESFDIKKAIEGSK